MLFWIHCDRQAQEGDLRRMQILTTSELSLAEDLRGPFSRPEEAHNIAESLIWAIVAKVLERLRSEPPRRFAVFPLTDPSTSLRVTEANDFAQGDGGK